MAAISVGRAIDLFLAHLAECSTPGTHAWYASYLREFRLFAGERRVAQLTPALVGGWVSRRYGDKSRSAQHSAARCVKRLCNWLVDEGVLPQSPIHAYRKPPPSHRERVLSGAEYAAIVSAARPPLRDVVKFLWHTGARPKELRTAQAAWIGDRKIVYPALKSKGERRRRVVYLDKMAAAIAARLSELHPEGPIFRDKRGHPWTNDMLALAFRRLALSVGAEGVCPYTLRHTWITRLLERGVPVATVAALAGNSPAMILRVYNHIADNEDHLRRHLG